MNTCEGGLNKMADVMDDIVQATMARARVDAVYLYGSRAKQTARESSDWDVAVLFSEYEPDVELRLLRPQVLEAELERALKLYGRVSVIDLETAPVRLQYSVIMSARKLFDRNVPHVKRVENAILSSWEKDYERYGLRAGDHPPSSQDVKGAG